MDTEKQQSDMVEIDLREIFSVLTSKIWLIFFVVLFAALAAFLVSKLLITPQYQSTTKIYILNKQENSAVTYSDVQMGTQLTKDYAELITSRYVLEEVNLELSLGLEYERLQGKIDVTTPADTRIVVITVTDKDPVMAMKIANAVREVSAKHIENVMDIEAVNVVETANLPTEKSSPSTTKWTLAGGIAGFILICAIILIRFLLDDTIKSSEDVEHYLGLSTLSLIPIREDEKNVKKKRFRSPLKV